MYNQQARATTSTIDWQQKRRRESEQRRKSVEEPRYRTGQRSRGSSRDRREYDRNPAQPQHRRQSSRQLSLEEDLQAARADYTQVSQQLRRVTNEFQHAREQVDILQYNLAILDAQKHQSRQEVPPEREQPRFYVSGPATGEGLLDDIFRYATYLRLIDPVIEADGTFSGVNATSMLLDVLNDAQRSNEFERFCRNGQRANGRHYIRVLNPPRRPRDSEISSDINCPMPRGRQERRSRSRSRAGHQGHSPEPRVRCGPMLPREQPRYAQLPPPPPFNPLALGQQLQPSCGQPRLQAALQRVRPSHSTMQESGAAGGQPVQLPARSICRAAISSIGAARTGKTQHDIQSQRQIGARKLGVNGRTVRLKADQALALPPAPVNLSPDFYAGERTMEALEGELPDLRPQIKLRMMEWSGETTFLELSLMNHSVELKATQMEWYQLMADDGVGEAVVEACMEHALQAWKDEVRAIIPVVAISNALAAIEHIAQVSRTQSPESMDAAMGIRHLPVAVDFWMYTAVCKLKNLTMVVDEWEEELLDQPTPEPEPQVTSPEKLDFSAGSDRE